MHGVTTKNTLYMYCLQMWSQVGHGLNTLAVEYFIFKDVVAQNFVTVFVLVPGLIIWPSIAMN